MAEEVEVTVIFDPEADYSDQDNYDDDIAGAGQSDIRADDIDGDIIRSDPIGKANRPVRVRPTSHNTRNLPRLAQDQVIIKPQRESINLNNPYGHVRSDVYDISSGEDTFRYEVDRPEEDGFRDEDEGADDLVRQDEQIQVPRGRSKRKSRLVRVDQDTGINPSPEVSKNDYELLVAMSESQVQNDLNESPLDYERMMASHPIYGSVEPRNDEDIEGFILPKKLPNPCRDSKERQHLHRELLINKKLGIDVLHQKSDLKIELDKRKSVMKLKEAEERQKMKQTPFQKKLEEQAEKLKKLETKGEETQKETPAADPQKDAISEFYKVHEKIRNSKMKKQT